MVKEFKEDLNILLERLCGGADEGLREKLSRLKDRLISLHEERLVKINHSVMELVCAKHLVSEGYDVNVEHPISNSLICDLYGRKGEGTLIIEIETGFVPPENALDPLTYWEARIASKIARYSLHSNMFGLGTPPNHILQIPPIFMEPPRERDEERLKDMKRKCDKYYKNPPINLQDLRRGFINFIYLINVDEGQVERIDPNQYLKTYRLIHS